MDAGLYFSAVLRPAFDAARWPVITLAVALAARDALAEACGLAADIKWPNDLLAGGRKLCGILAEASATPRGRVCVVGVGVNLSDRAFPPEIAAQATSVQAETRAAPDRERLLAALTGALAARYERLYDQDGARATVEAWSEASSFAAGRRVRVSLEDEEFEGTTRGLESDGALLVETDAGEVRIVRAGDVTAVRPARDG
jgi:BirA family biotin operon repressor/biotin-[acetyl-CoA-carboxylase] ligase